MNSSSAATILCLVSLLVAVRASGCATGETIIDGVCGKCPPGMTYDDPNSTCDTCEPNFFKDKEGNEPCSPCPANTLSVSGATKCITCPDGTAVLKNGECGTCPAGTYYSIHSGGCFRCSRGFFQPGKTIEGLSLACMPCPAGTTSVTGASSCTKCPSKQAVMKNGACGSCPPGTFYSRSLLRCKKCGRNTFQPSKNAMPSCISCPRNSSSGKGATNCVKCRRGQVLMRDGKCRKCPSGTRYDDERLRCLKCNWNEFSKGRGRKQFCKMCPKGSFANRGASKCFKCRGSQVLIAKNNNTGKCSKCKSGSVYNRSSATCDPK